LGTINIRIPEQNFSRLCRVPYQGAMRIGRPKTGVFKNG